MKNMIGKKCYELWFNVTDVPSHWSMSEYTVDDISFKGAIRLKGEDSEYSWIYPNNGFYKVMSDKPDGENEEYPTFFWDKDEAQKMLDHLNSISYVGLDLDKGANKFDIFINPVPICEVCGHRLDGSDMEGESLRSIRRKM